MEYCQLTCESTKFYQNRRVTLNFFHNFSFYPLKRFSKREILRNDVSSETFHVAP